MKPVLSTLSLHYSKKRQSQQLGNIQHPVKPHIAIIGPPKQDRKQSIKNKNNRSPSFHFDLFSGCRFVRFSGFSMFPYISRITR